VGSNDRPGLAPAYELALELEHAGLADDAIAERLGVPVRAVRSLLELAHAKASPRTPKGT
jgi:hypothetical protein